MSIVRANKKKKRGINTIDRWYRMGDTHIYIARLPACLPTKFHRIVNVK